VVQVRWHGEEQIVLLLVMKLYFLVMTFASARVQKAVEHNVKRIPIARIILVLQPTMIIAGKIV
jgi:hypothetical protein